MKYFILLFTLLIHWCFCSGAYAQTYIKGPALIEGFSEIATSAGTTTLTKGSQTNQFFTGTSTQTIVLPDATSLPLGRYFLIQNKSTGNITVNMNGGSLLTTVEPESQVKVTVTNIVSPAGVWNVSNSGGLTGVLGVDKGGTGIDGSAATNGSLLIGNGSGYSLSTLAPTTDQTTVTNGAGTITIGTAQDIATTSSPTFANETISGDITLSNAAFDSEKVGDTLAMHSSTGVRSGAAMTINGGDPTKFDIASGVGYIVNYATPSAPTIKKISIGPFTAQTVTNLASADFTWVMIDSSGSIVQQTSVPTAAQRRTNIVLGRLNHSDRTNLSFANTIPDFEFSPISQIGDLMDSLGPFNISGNLISANGANLSLNKSSGSIFQKSFNYNTSTNNPHVSTTPGITLLSFAYQNKTGGPGSYVTVLDPTTYDNGGTTTTIPGSGANSSVQRVYLFASNTLRIQRGQATYSSLANALNSFQNESFVVSPLIKDFGVLIAYIAIRKDCTNLKSSCAVIVPAGKFGSTASGGGGTTNLQQAYLNSTQPQITLNSTQSGLELRDASTPIGVDLLSVKNNAGSRKYFSVGAGFIGVPQSSSAEIAAFPDQKGNLAYNTTNEKLTVHQNTGRDGMILTRGYAENLTLVNNDTLFLNLYDTDQTFLVAGGSGPITLDSTAPFGFAGTKFNQLKVTLIGNSDTNTVTIPAGTAANTVLGYSVTLGRGQTATYQWNATLNQFVIISVSN